jgi:phage gp36-like protein
MSYLANSDIEKRLGTAAYVQLTDDEGTGSANEDRVDEARLGAEGEANSYLARRYAVPVDLSGHPELAAVLESFVLDLAEYRLHGRRPPVSQDVLRRRQEAVQWLWRVAEGQVYLPAAAAPAAGTSSGTVAEVSGAERVFDRDELDRL